MKTKLICEYCGNEIGENDKKCPNCGANTSKITSAYKEEKEQEEQEKKAQQEESIKKVAKITGFAFLGQYVIAGIIMIVIIGLFIFGIVTGIKSAKKISNSKNKVQNNVTVGYQEKGKTSNLEATLLSYDLYEYSSEHFDSYNTKDGYQKIAFEFEVENITNEKILSLDIVLKADGYNVQKSDLNVDKAFATLKQGKTYYEPIDLFVFEAHDIQKGYVGFEVPKDKKELIFKIGNNLTIKMDNPVYSE